MEKETGKYDEMVENTKNIEKLFLFGNTMCSCCRDINFVEASEIMGEAITDEDTWKIRYMYLLGVAVKSLYADPHSIIPLEKEWPICCQYLRKIVEEMDGDSE